MFWVLAISLIIVNLIVDILEIIINLLAPVFLIGFVLDLVFGFIIEPFVDLITILILLIMGGDLGYKALAKRMIVYGLGILAEFIPGIDALPLRTITLIVTIFLIYTSQQAERKTEEQQTEEEMESKTEEETEKEEKLYQPTV